MKINLYKADLIGLSTETKPSNQIDGTTFYCVDTMQLYISYKNVWYLQDENAESSNNSNNSNER